jgi:ATP-binding cassette subfamily C (CFTR/MRP) protein 4
MQWAVRQTAEAENNITSVERMLAYTRLPSEPLRVAEGGGAPPPGWPASGHIHFQSVSARYRAGLPPVLKTLTFTIQVLQQARKSGQAVRPGRPAHLCRAYFCKVLRQR